MKTASAKLSIFAFVLAALWIASARADGPAADDTLYSDPDAQSSATVTQVLPNSSTSQMLLTNVKTIRVRQEILIINWGGSATTLLPRQFVTGLTVNKRALLLPPSPPPPTPTTAPGVEQH